jgi:hypothetical protein
MWRSTSSGCRGRSEMRCPGRSVITARKGAGGQPAPLRCLPSLREGSLRCSGPWPRRGTHCAHCVRFVRPTAASQFTKRATRAGHGPCASRLRICAAPAARPRLCQHHCGVRIVEQPERLARRAVPGGGDFWGAEHRSSALGARTRALRDLTRRDCLSATTGGSEASFAARARCEKRRGVGAQRRPPQHEPLPGTARRAAHTPRKKGA